MNKLMGITIVWFLWISCNSHENPKPHGYFRFDFPKKEYRVFDSVSIPFSFAYPVYGNVVHVTSKEKYWFNINFPAYNATIYLSYREVNNDLGDLTEDAYKLLYKHHVKADGIEPQQYTNEKRHLYGLLFDIGGDAASSIQFYLTDSTKNFIRGALYFYCEPNRDSLVPLIDFFKEDIQYMIETFTFEDKL